MIFKGRGKLGDVNLSKEGLSSIRFDVQGSIFILSCPRGIAAQFGLLEPGVELAIIFGEVEAEVVEPPKDTPAAPATPSAEGNGG